MFSVGILLFLLLSGGRAFMIYNTHHSLCLEDSATSPVLLKRCNPDSEFQQWVWIGQGMLMCIGSSRCLSAQQMKPVWTRSCGGPDGDAAGLMWDCDRDRLMSRNMSMLLAVDGQHLTLSLKSKHSKWKSLDEGDICQEKLRLRRASADPDEFAEEHPDEMEGMTEETKAYLRWFHRTEDPTTWKFVLLGLSFVCLLVGFLLLGMGAMANKNRKKIAKYKAAAAASSPNERLEMTSLHKDDSNCKPSPPSPGNGEVEPLRAGKIVVTWKDGNTSCLYPDPEEQKEEEEGKKEEEEEKKQSLESEAEMYTQDEVKTVE
nr:solute carrier family 51 subunit beta [Solea senegalensis]